MKYFKLLPFLLIMFMLYQCEETLTSGGGETTYSIASVNFSEHVDQNSNGYAASVKFTFDVDVSSGSEDVVVKIGYRLHSETSGDYTLYFQSIPFTISDGSSDAQYIVIGNEENGELSHNSYDFLLQVFKDGEETVLAEAKSSNNSSMGNVLIETSTEDSPMTHAQFTNKVFTDITIKINSNMTEVVSPGDSVVFDFSGNPGNIAIYAETNGKTNSGTQIGEKLLWDSNYDMSGYDFVKFDLEAGSNYFFLYIKNSGTTDLGPIHVNYGSSDESELRVIDVNIPNNEVNYRLGYFFYSNYGASRVAAFKAGTTDYVYWDLTSTGLKNQYWSLTNSLKKTVVTSNNSIIQTTMLEHPIVGQLRTTTKSSNNAVHLMPN